MSPLRGATPPSSMPPLMETCQFSSFFRFFHSHVLCFHSAVMGAENAAHVQCVHPRRGKRRSRRPSGSSGAGVHARDVRGELIGTGLHLLKSPGRWASRRPLRRAGRALRCSPLRLQRRASNRPCRWRHWQRWQSCIQHPQSRTPARSISFLSFVISIPSSLFNHEGSHYTINGDLMMKPSLNSDEFFLHAVHCFLKK